MLLDSFLIGFGCVGGFCAVVTLLLRLWSGAFEALVNSLYAHVSHEKLPLCQRNAGRVRLGGCDRGEDLAQ